MDTFSTLPNGELLIYIVRHGQTFFNKTKQVQGWCNTPLTDIGEREAKAVGKGMENIKFNSAFSSDLGRAVQTAEIILAENKNETPVLIQTKELREWFYGGFEGRDDNLMWGSLFHKFSLDPNTKEDSIRFIVSKYGYDTLANSINETDPFNIAERYEDIKNRTIKGLKFLIKTSLDAGSENALLVSHGSEITSIVDIVSEVELPIKELSNGSVTTLIYKNGKLKVLDYGNCNFVLAGKKQLGVE